MKGRSLEALLASGVLLLLSSCGMKDPKVPFNRGIELEGAGRFEEAAKAYQEAIQDNPGFAPAYDRLGDVYLRQGEFEAAEQEYRIALQFKPDSPDAHNDLGQALTSLKRFDEAEKELREALRLEPDLIDTRLTLGFVLRKNGRVQEAEEEYREVLRQDPHNDWALYDLASCYVLEHQNEKALHILHPIVDRGFDNWPVLSNDSDLAGLRGDPRFEDLTRLVKVRWLDKKRTEGETP